MKAISEFKSSVQNPTGNEWLIVNKSLGNNNYRSHKVKLSSVKEYIETTSPVVVEVTVAFDANGGTGGWT